ncbi:unnamed protein product [Blepharisma stoltei]|uniref:Kelch motif family protein n=1 Tax=Blepharisma stoltei TaxID=1481888 RepID=A0AAU9KNS3_9CILI|nr:unnamed protein product [Blepharisma stoltei]
MNQHISTYQNKTYLIPYKHNQTNLFIYDTESERETVQVLSAPEILNFGTCITLLPNGELFCFGKIDPYSGISLIIDQNFDIRVLPSGTCCACSSGIYLNNSVYCFGGEMMTAPLPLAERFDLDENRWIMLNPMEEYDYYCSCVMFNGNILITGFENKNIWRYSVEEDSYTRISFEFADIKRKILISDISERLYLIECGGLIFESEIEDDNAWKPIGSSLISNVWPVQVSYAYNGRAVYFSMNSDEYRYKFDLDEKNMIKFKN